jgi:hypothetical protein
MKKIDNRQNRQNQRVCGRPFSATKRLTSQHGKLQVGIRAKSQKRAIRVA